MCSTHGWSMNSYQYSHTRVCLFSWSAYNPTPHAWHSGHLPWRREDRCEARQTGPKQLGFGWGTGKPPWFSPVSFAIMTWIAVASCCPRPWTGTTWWFIPRLTGIAVPPPSVNRSLRWQTEFAIRKTTPGLRWVSVNRYMSILYCPRKWSSSCFLPRTPSTFQQVNRKALVHVVRLGRAPFIDRSQPNLYQL